MEKSTPLCTKQGVGVSEQETDNYYSIDIKVVCKTSSLYYEVVHVMQPENANGADTLPHELQEWY